MVRGVKPNAGTRLDDLGYTKSEMVTKSLEDKMKNLKTQIDYFTKDFSLFSEFLKHS